MILFYNYDFIDFVLCFMLWFLDSIVLMEFICFKFFEMFVKIG